MVAHVLWAKGDTTPKVCYRENWQHCNEHKELSRRPYVKPMGEITLPKTNLVDTTSVEEYLNKTK